MTLIAPLPETIEQTTLFAETTARAGQTFYSGEFDEAAQLYRTACVLSIEEAKTAENPLIPLETGQKYLQACIFTANSYQHSMEMAYRLGCMGYDPYYNYFVKKELTLDEIAQAQKQAALNENYQLAAEMARLQLIVDGDYKGQGCVRELNYLDALCADMSQNSDNFDYMDMEAVCRYADNLAAKGYPQVIIQKITDYKESVKSLISRKN